MGRPRHHSSLPSPSPTGRARHMPNAALLVVALLLSVLSVVHGNAFDMVTGYCSTPLTTGTQIMGTPAEPSTLTLSLSRAGVLLSPEPTSPPTLLYTPGETLKLSLPGANGDIAWEATGGASYNNNAGCAGRKRSAAKSPFLQMPSDGVSTVQVWAGHASGHTTVRITPTVTLTPRPAAPSLPPFPPSSSPPAAVPSPPTPTTPPSTSLSPPKDSGKVFASYFIISISNLPLSSFKLNVAKALIADAAALSPSQVYLEATTPSMLRRLWHSPSRHLLRHLKASSTDLAIRLTNLPDEQTANALVASLGTYFISTQPTGFASQYVQAANPSSTSTAPPSAVVLRESGASVFTVGTFRASCSLDSMHGLALSWEVNDALTAVELQLEGEGEGWIAGGVVDENTAMVTSPAHKVLLFDYGSGAAQALALQGYDARDLKEVDGPGLGMTPLLLQGAAGKLYMRYDQSLARASVPIDLTSTTNFMWAWAEFGYPAIHDHYGTVKIDWAAGTCKRITDQPSLEGYWLLLLPFLSLLLTWTGLKQTSWGHSLLQRRLGPIPTQLSTWVRTLTRGAIPAFLNLKYGEAWMMAFYGILQVALLAYWTVEEGGVGVRTTGIAFGKAALTNLMMMYLPVSKTTLWVRVCGISFERAVKFHRQLSYLAMATMTIHLVCMTRNGPAWDRTPLASGVVIAYGLLAFLSFAFMSLTAMLRRWCYELFRYAHYLYIAGTVFVLLHAPEAWQYLVIPCVVHALDFLWRWFGILRNPTTATLSTFPGNVTQVEVVSGRKEGNSSSSSSSSSAGGRKGKWAVPLEPGSYVWVCIPRLSLLQWHPISISTAGLLQEGGERGADAPLFRLHIKSLGKGAWTNDLYQLAAQEAVTPHSHDPTAEDNAPSAPPLSPPALSILVDGPYGKLSIELGRYQQLVLVAGGIGITPMTSILSYISHHTRNGTIPRLKTVTLVWVLRDVALFDGFASFLDQIAGELNGDAGERPQPPPEQQQRVRFAVQIYVTEGGANATGGGSSVGLEEGSKAMQKQLGTRLVDGGGGGKNHVRTQHGRPNISEIFDALVNDSKGGQPAASTGVLACAPEGLLHQVQRQCVLLSCDVHMEEFAW